MFKSVSKEQLKVPAHIDYLADLRDFVTRVGKKHGFSDRVINAFKLAIDEAGTNIMRHAYRDTGGEGFITIRAIVKKDNLTICLIDQGKYFDPKHVKDPDLQRYVEIGKKGGLGIFIMRRLMDDIEYRKTEEGNELRLTKNRDGPPRRSKFRMPFSKAVKAIPLSLKVKYWMRTTLVLAGVIGVVYAYYFWQARVQETAQFFDEFFRLSNIASTQLSDPQILDDLSGIKANEIIAKVHELEEIRKTVREIILVDPTGMVLGHTDPAKRLQPWSLPPQHRQVRKGLLAYILPMPDGRGGQTSKEIYDHVIPLGAGELHVRVLKESLDRRIASRRWNYARIAGLLLVASCAGTFFLIYILMNPFRKLADWVRRADHGALEDEMDIDASTEIGEIAQAFSEITTKFRESQKNLAEQERLQKEMQVAQEIQQTLLPSEFPELEGYEIASYYEAAREVGGDYFDFVEVDKDSLGIAVADVSGKGVPGSLVMTMIRTALRTEARGIKDAAEVLSRVNDFVIGDMKKGMFVTVFYVIIDGKRRRLNYASAGHNPMILYRTSTNKTYYLNPRGFPIGIQLHEKDLFKKSIESDTIQLAEDDILLIYTDGITEAMNAKRELFGEERLLKIFREHGHLRVKPFVEQIKEEILSFTEGNPQSDDITLVAIREKTSPEKEELRRAKEAHQLISAGKSIREACEKVGITTYAYYNKYKKEFEEKGIENYEIDVDVSVEAKHIAIEDKVKIYDIIKNHPEYGAKRISEELNTDKYGFTIISESKIYDELVRSRLNTRQLREAFVARGGRSRRPMKQPGTPMLTLDGKIILDRSHLIEAPKREPAEETPQRAEGEKPRIITQRPEITEPPVKAIPRPSPKPATYEPAPAFAQSDSEAQSRPRKDVTRADIDVRTLQTPLEELLDRKRDLRTTPKLPEDRDGEGQAPSPLPRESVAFETTADIPPAPERTDELPPVPLPFVDLSAEANSLPEPVADLPSTRQVDKRPGPSSPGMIDISFEDLFAGGTILEELSSSATEVTSPPSVVSSPAESAPALPEGGHPEEDASVFAVEEVLRQELESHFGGSSTVVPAEEPGANASGPASSATPPEAAATALPSEVDLPFVDVHEILQQEGAESSTRVVHDQVTTSEKRPAPFPEAFQESPAQQSQRNQTPGDGGPGAYEQRPKATTASKSTTQIPAAARTEAVIPPGPPLQEHATRAPVKPHPSVIPERRRDGWNGAGRGDDERERLLITGLRHYKNQRFDDAIAEFEKAIRLYPDFKEAYSILGNAYFRNRMFEKAAKAYARVKEMDPHDTTAYENMGVIYANRGDYMGAMREWQRVLEIDPNRDDIRKKIERASRMLTRKAIV
ncbi:MAG: SpoIIE family protein phosphatase [candidate division KSB1 bacterium]|nr:SpoIIE family protein phosphatase [candidate division KSB1 bacterium]MDZ7305352.1 SpoIIE family protein phosphatase [candidate division KSB1 bacterium]MDZ7314444.1 SpoIIE family protein phosphatase [candidate division KSB1 bacterium]